MRYLFIALAWTSVFCTASGQSSWEVLSPLPTSANLNDVHFLDAKFGVAVGQDLPFVLTNDGGVSWSKAGWTTNYDFLAVSFGSAMNGIIVGEYMMRTNNGGIDWSHDVWVDAALADVWFSDAETATAVGRKNSRSSIYRTTDAGRSWSEQYTSAESSLRSVMFVDNDFGWTVGMFGAIVRTTNGGDTWLTLPSVTEAHYYGVAFFDRRRGIVVGDGGTILRTEDGGVTWIAQTSGTKVALRSIACLNTSTAITVGDSGIILRSIDGGGAWSKLSVGRVEGLQSISITDDGIISVVGNGGMLLQSIDGGDTWKSFTLTTTSLFGVTQRNDKVGTVVGDYGDIMQTVDGGKSWVMQPSGTTNRLEDVAYKNDDEGIIVGDTTLWDGPGTILRTTDAGKNWLSVNHDFRGNLNAVCYLDESTTIAVGGYSVILRSTDAGLTWGSQSNAGEYDLQDVAFFDSRAGMAVGSFGTIMKTFDGGVTWSRMGIGDRNHLTGVGFIDKDTWIVAGWIPYRGGITFRSEDAGQTWIPQDTLPYSVMNLCASTSEQLIIGGIGGGMSVSTDRGKTWQPVVSNTMESLNAISQSESGLGFAVGSRGAILRNTGNSGTNVQIVDVSSATLLELFRPNPAAESTRIIFRVRMQGQVTIDICDWTGKLVANITSENFVPGTYDRILDTHALPSGPYTCRFHAGQVYESQNFLVLH